jgi:hypothetical protein
VHTIQDPYSAPRKGLPGWLISLLVTAVALGGGYFLYNNVLSDGSGQAAAAPKEQAEVQGAASASAHPYAKVIELAGLRFTEERGKNRIQFIVINHSSGELDSFNMVVSVSTTAAKPGDAPLTSVSVKVDSLGPWESKEMTVPVDTRMKAYEMPDWQFLKAAFEISSQP